jgi:hypothetical protein
MNDFSVVIPIKDETDLLPYSLPSAYMLEPDEVILTMEPNEDTIKTAKKISAKFKHIETKILVLNEETPSWRDRHAYARRKGFMKCRNDTIVTVDIDKVVDPKVKEHLHLIGKNNVGLISFIELPFPFDLRRYVAAFIQKIGYRDSFTGLYAFSKKAWIKTEDKSKAKRITTSEDTQLHEGIKTKYKTIFVSNTKNILIRPKESKRYQILMGVERRRHGDSFLKLLVSSILFLRPLNIVGFLKCHKIDGTKT